MHLIPHLNFNGNCKAAMKFYHKCFGGKLQFQTLEESPMVHEMPEKMKKLIVMASLQSKQFHLLGSDLIDDKAITVGNHISISVFCKSEKELDRIYKQLCYENIHKKMKSELKTLSIMFRDKFGLEWILFCH